MLLYLAVPALLLLAVPVIARVGRHQVLHRPTDRTLPTISGEPQEGHVLRASPGSWTGAPAFTYRWLACNGRGRRCKHVRAKVAHTYMLTKPHLGLRRNPTRTYLLTKPDVGHTIRVTVIAVNARGRASATSAPTPVIVSGSSTGGLPTVPPSTGGPQTSGAPKPPGASSPPGSPPSGSSGPTGSPVSGGPPPTGGSGPPPPPPSSTPAHYLYTVTEGSIGVFDIDNGFAQKGTISLPQTAGHGIRGVAADPASHTLFVSYGGDGGNAGNVGRLLAYDLVNNKVLWTQTYSHGIDSMAITPDGSTIYMPDGEQTGDGKWYAIDAATGQEKGAVIDTGGTGDHGPHNTIVSLDGQHVYMGDRNLGGGGTNYFYVASTATNQVTQKVGPFKSGIRPFTVNKANTLVYASVTGYKGFQVGDLTSGKVLYSAPITEPAGTSCPNTSGATDPSHGVSLSPDGTQLYVIDWPCNGVAVFDVSGVPATAPKQVAWIQVSAFDPNQSPCSYDCLGDGWLLHSSDGRYVFVGDSGDVIDTATHTVAAHLNDLYNTRVYVEIDWSGGAPSFTTTRSGLGR